MIGKACQLLSRSYYRAKMAGIQSQTFDYFLVLDFEATCERGKKMEPQEIIEFPILKVNGKTFDTEATFHQYVQPRVNLELTSFCTELTGIIQDMVNDQPFIEDTLEKIDDWMKNEGLLNPDVKSIFVTCGDWDLKTMLPSQSKYFKISYGDYLKHWINIKRPWAKVKGSHPRDLDEMLKGFNLSFDGRPHSGIDDCRNIARVLKAIAETGLVFEETGCIN